MPPELACCAALETEPFTAVDSKFFFTAAFILRAALSASPPSTFTPNQLFSQTSPHFVLRSLKWNTGILEHSKVQLFFFSFYHFLVRKTLLVCFFLFDIPLQHLSVTNQYCFETQMSDLQMFFFFLMQNVKIFCCNSDHKNKMQMQTSVVQIDTSCMDTYFNTRLLGSFLLMRNKGSLLQMLLILHSIL